MPLRRCFVPRVLLLFFLFAWIAAVDGHAAGNFVPTGNMALRRTSHQATLLRNGMVLITGAGTPNAELYDPDAGTFTSTGNMAVGRRSHRATLLQDGRVLITGGYDDKNQPVTLAEIYDPLRGVFVPAGEAPIVIRAHAATLLNSGKVLIVAEDYPPQLYEPSTGAFSSTGDSLLPGASRWPGIDTATLLPNGKVLLLEYLDYGSPTYYSTGFAELYDPEADAVSQTGPMKYESAVYEQTATLLPNGKVLLAGGHYGWYYKDSDIVADAEIYDPATGEFTGTRAMATPRSYHKSTLLRDGTVLVAGGLTQFLSPPYYAVASTSELYDPVAGKFAAGPVMTLGRESHTATLLRDGRVLITGGSYRTATGHADANSAELYVPEGWSPAPAIVITEHPASQTMTPGSSAVLTVSASGSGTVHYQWRRNGLAIAGATDARLAIMAATAANAGDYDVVVTNIGGSVTSRMARVLVDTPRPGRLVNLSVRAMVRDAGSPLIVGAAAAGGSKRVLIRALGPALARFGVAGFLADPRLEVHATVNGRDTIVAQNGDWGEAGGATALRAVFNTVGAFDLPDAASRDAALVTTIDTACRVHVSDAAAGNGIVFVELYDADANAPARLINLSGRSTVSGDGGSLIAGFVIDGNAPKRLLIRGIGPHLATKFGVSGALTDPKLELYLSEGGRSSLFAANDDWAEAGAAPMRAAFVAAGAFDLPDANSRDAALVVTVPAGVYTASVSGTGNAIGEALIEIYEIP